MDRSAQLEELDSLKSIYYSEEFQVTDKLDQNEEIQAIFWAFVKLPDDYSVKYLENLESSEPSYLKLKHLPPIELQLTLPEDYPSKNPPKFVISCQWLHKSKISMLCKKLDDIWSEYGAVEIIYVWCDFLKNDSLNFLGYENELDITELCSIHLSFIKKLQKNEEEKKLRMNNGLKCGVNKSDESKIMKDNSANGNGSVTENMEPVDNGNQSTSNTSVNINLMNSKSPKGDYFRYRKKYPYVKRNNESKDTSPRPNVLRNVYDGRAVLNLGLKMSPVRLLENYNSEREKVEFLRNFYTCNICFSDKLGKDCIKFQNCNHVFCSNCIRMYFTIKIKDGTVQSIKCPEEKCSTDALPSQIKEVVSEELFAKYDSVLLSTALDTLNDIIYCPRQMCQYPVSWDPEEKMATCPNCQYVFCVTCKMVYHGIEPCRYKSGEVQKLVEQYENASSEVKAQMESRYGKKHLESLVNNTKTEAWIKDNSKACPRCEANIEKSQGCNKMVCWKCNANFCWLCFALLDPKDPYLHFRDPHSHCANKLFYLVPNFDDDEEWDDWDWVDNSGDELEFSDTDFGEDDDDGDDDDDDDDDIDYP